MAAKTHSYSSPLLKRLSIFFHISQPANQHIWLGANDLATEGTYVWQGSGLAMTYSKWNPGEPNGGTGENCANLWGHVDTWNDWNCGIAITVMCEVIYSC